MAAVRTSRTLATFLTLTMFPVAARSWCYEMRVVQAFSWMIFCLCLSSFFPYLFIRLHTDPFLRPMQT